MMYVFKTGFEKLSNVYSCSIVAHTVLISFLQSFSLKEQKIPEIEECLHAGLCPKVTMFYNSHWPGEIANDKALLSCSRGAVRPFSWDRFLYYFCATISSSNKLLQARWTVKQILEISAFYFQASK